MIDDNPYEDACSYKESSNGSAQKAGEPKPANQSMRDWRSDYNQAERQEQIDFQREVVHAAAKKLLASEGYDPQFGARPFKRAIQEQLLDPLATKLLAGEFKPNDKIKVSAKDGELAFARK